MRTLNVLIITMVVVLAASVKDVHAQLGQVAGTVIDQQTAAPVASAQVLVQGANIGALTDAQGRFIITNVPAGERTIVAQRIGYVTRASQVMVTGGGTATLTFALTQAAIALDEVVVVGYGTAERRNVTGAIDQVNGEMIAARPIPNLTQGLQGMLPNVNIRPLDGKPIQAPAINIRGTTSIGSGGNALVLIDGVEGDPAMINPSDIESVTVLKDASSAAVYGARGAFGVLLITTRKPSADQFSVTYGTTYGFRQPVARPDLVTDGYTFARMFDQAFRSSRNGAPAQNVNKTLLFSPEYLAELERRSKNPQPGDQTVEIGANGQYEYYGSTDWYELLYRDRSPSLEHNITITRGTDATRFMVSGRYLRQDGLFRYNSDDFATANFRANGSVRLTDWLEFNNNFDYSNRTYHNPLNVGEGGGIWRNLQDEGHVLAPMFNPDGTLTHSASYSVGDFYYGKNGFDFERSIYRNTSELSALLLNNQLQLTADFTFQKTTDDEQRRQVPVPYSRRPGNIEYVGAATNNLRNIHDNANYLTTNLYGSYEALLGSNHSLRAMAGVNYEERTSERLLAERNGLIFPDAEDLNLALGQSTVIGGGYEKWNIFGGFTRLNYTYGDRYLLEFTGRYDGSSKFPEDQRYAFFPSFSGAWRISQEPFWKISPDLVSDLRLRASWGSMGNGNVASYAFQETFNISQSGRIINGVRPQQTSAPGVLPAGLTWETATTTNFGLDLDMFNNRLTFSGDAYTRETTDMFTVAVTPPAVFGAGTPRGNYADLETRGWEFSLGWQDAFEVASRPATYGIRLSLSDYESTILKYNNERGLLSDYRVGQKVGEIWGYITEGFFADSADIVNHANQSPQISPRQGGVWLPGDIKLRDLNGDGVINAGESTEANPGDRTVIGNTTPRYSFGINLSGAWAGFSLSGFFQGVGKQDWRAGNEADFFWGQYNRPYNDIPKWQLEEGVIWTPENPNPNAFLPRYTGYSWIREAQSKYVMNVAYVRLKNLQLGYSLPQSLAERFGFRNGSIYVTAENLWTYAPLYKTVTDVDVENLSAGSDRVVTTGGSGDGLNYPMMKSLVTGITLTF